MRLLLTMGTFEIAHAGHAAFLRKCESYADQVVVGVNTDEFVWEYKKIKPLYTLEERIHRIGVLNPAYRVVPNPSAGRELIETHQPDVVAVGSDWLHRDYLTQINMTASRFEDLGCALLFLPYTAGVSSTEIKERLDA